MVYKIATILNEVRRMDEQKYNLYQSLAELDKLIDVETKETDSPNFTLITEKLKALQENFPESEKLAEACARVLVKLSAMQTTEKDLVFTIEKILTLYKEFPDSKDIALQYAKILVNLSTQQTVLKELEATVEKVQGLQHQFQDSHDIALQYAIILFNLSTQQTVLKELEATAKKVQGLQHQFQDSHDIALRYAKILINLSSKQTELNELETTVKKVQGLQHQFHDSPNIALPYAMILVNLSTQQIEISELKDTAEKVQELQQQFHDSPDIALHYAHILVNLSIKQIEINELKATTEKLQELLKQFPDSHNIAEAFSMFLVNLSVKQTEAEDREVTAENLQEILKQFPNSHNIAVAVARMLFNLSIEYTEINKLSSTAEKLQELLTQFSNSHDIAEIFSSFLVNLSAKQTEVEDREITAEKLQEIQEQFLDSHDIALKYAMILFNVSTNQTGVAELETTAEKVKGLQQQFQESEEIAFIYGMFLSSLSDHQTELGERLQTKETIKKLYEQFSKFMLQNFDDLFFRDDNVCYREEYKLFNFILKEGLLKNTKYAILQTWAERYKENSSELKNLLSIYQLVQKIKYQLGLKDEDKNQMLKFGHYTKGSTLQIMLNQEGNDKKDFSVSGKTRLYNANYMNDPEEGIVIEQILGLDRRDILEPSSWFLMSFTNKTDDLAMWSQYGDDAKGVCLVLREDDFSRFTSFNDVSWRQEKNFLEFSDKMYLLKSELNSGFEKSIFRSESENSVDTVNDEGTKSNSVEKDSDSKGNSDYLYRIAYVRHTEENLKLERTELFEKSEIEELEKLLNSLKEKLDIGLKITEKNYQDAISECIEEIRYLFKSVDYKYENELRILRYANLEPSNKEIKIDKTSGVGKLYIERKNSIQIGEVIFGPKFPNPEYVTPLLKLLDENIDYKKSTIKFR